MVATVEYYETGSYDKFKRYFIEAYQEIIEAIIAVEASRERERNEPLRGL